MEKILKNRIFLVPSMTTLLCGKKDSIFICLHKIISLFLFLFPYCQMDTEYLRKTVGPALSQGLFETSAKKPTDPIDFLGKYLLQRTNWEETQTSQKESDRLFKEALAKRHEERRLAKEAQERAIKEAAAKAEAERLEREQKEKEAAAAAAAAAATANNNTVSGENPAEPATA